MSEKEKPRAVGAAQGQGPKKLLTSILSIWDDLVKQQTQIEMAKEKLRKAYLELYKVYTRALSSEYEEDLVEVVEKMGAALAAIGVLEDE